ncbi:MAG: acyl carrier protein [Clostridia bacterium]|nr:acyl carrier protein [Clostridia bacterium]
MKEKIVEILADYKNVDISEIKTDVPFTELGLDSLDVAELVMQIEDELGVTLEMSIKYNTVDKLADYIAERT